MNRQILGGGVLSFVSQIISILVGLLYTPIMIRLLGQQDYGLLQLIQSVVNYLNLLSFGLTGAYLRFYYRAKLSNDPNEIAKLNGIFFRIFVFISCVCGCCGCFLFFNINILGSNLTDSDYIIARELLIITVINVVISFPASLFSLYISAHERFVFQKSVLIIFNILLPILNIPVLYLGYGSVGIVSVSLFLFVLRIIVLFFYCFNSLNMSINFFYFDKKVFFNLFSYSFFIFLCDIIYQVNTNIDKLLLGNILGVVPVAIYSVGLTLKHFYEIASWVIPELFVPEVNKLAVTNKDDDKLNYIFSRVGRYNNYVLLLFFSVFILLGKDFIYLWVGREYESSFYVCLILILSNYITSIQTLGVNIQNAKNLHRPRALIYFAVAIFNVIISIVLIKKIGIMGAPIGTLIACLLFEGFFMNIYYHFYIKLNIIQFWKAVSCWIIFVFILDVICFKFMQLLVLDSWIKLFCSAFVYSLIYCGVLYFCELDIYEKYNIKKILHSFFLKLRC